MILETAKMKVSAENHKDFEAALETAVQTVLSQAEGFIDIDVHKGIEEPDTYLLHIYWETLEDHTIGFRESDLFIQWRALIGPFFAAQPEVTHWTIS